MKAADQVQFLKDLRALADRAEQFNIALGEVIVSNLLNALAIDIEDSWKKRIHVIDEGGK